MLRIGGELDKAVNLVDGVDRSLPAHAAWLADLLVLEAAEARIAQGRGDDGLRILGRVQSPDPAAVALVRGHAQLVRRDWSAVTESVRALVGASTDQVALHTAVEARLLEAAYELRTGHDRRARAALGRALRLAGPESLRRPFHEAPPVVHDLLMTDLPLLNQNPWLGAAFSPHPPGSPARLAVPGKGTDAAAADELLEPLTGKEQEVLGHLAELLTTEEIAAAMFVSVNTVRTHVRSILRKLAVSRRNEAVRRARALRLIAA